MTLNAQIEEAYELLESGELEAAEALAQKLSSANHPAGFDILATLYAEKEQLQQAINILEEGIKQIPDACKLWMRLGIFQSDMEQYEEAEYSLFRSEFLPNADAELVNLNKAVLYKRTKKFDQAFNALEKARVKYPMESLDVELSIHDDLGEYNTILSRFREAGIQQVDESDTISASNIHFQLAKAYWHLKKLDLAQEALDSSLVLNRSNKDALWLRREMWGKIAEVNRYFTIMLNGDWYEEGEDGEKLKFFTTYDVVALEIEDALEMIKAFEPVELDKASFRIEEYEEHKNWTGNPTGIYRTSGFSVYVEE